MTSTDHTPDLPIPPELAVIAAFLDGERVDAVVLKHALSTGEGRDYLADLLALRQAVVAMGPVSYLASPTRSRGRTIRRWAVAAAVALLASVGGYLAGERAGLVADVRGAGSSVEAVASFDAVPLAPQPTHVIQLEPIPAGDASEGK